MDNSTDIEDKTEDLYYYCTKCLSLDIKEDEDICYCDKCGCTSISSCTFDEWVEMKDKKYPFKKGQIF
jgi:hypothetical protein